MARSCPALPRPTALQSIGYWPPHLQLSLLSAGITETFQPELEVGGVRSASMRTRLAPALAPASLCSASFPGPRRPLPGA